jgi:hypothetical protein
MKKLLIGTALVAMLATPALAQSFDPDFGTGNIDPPVASLYGGQRYDSQGLTDQGARVGGGGPYAYAPGGSGPGPHWSSQGNYFQRQDSNYPVYAPNDWN